MEILPCSHHETRIVTFRDYKQMNVNLSHGLVASLCLDQTVLPKSWVFTETCISLSDTAIGANPRDFDR
jgi:hypothetical protein